MARRKISKLQVWLACYLDRSNPETFLNGTASAKEASYKCTSDAAFRAVGCNNIKKCAPQIKQWIEEQGLTDEALKIKLMSLLDAKETKFFQHEGKVTDQRDVDALGIQIKAVELGMRVNGLFAPEKHQHSGTFILDYKPTRDESDG